MSPALRKFPFPFRNMLAVLSDTDLSSKAEFEGMHRFMNTRAECGPLGRGVGLDVGDTFWMGTVGRNDDGGLPVEEDHASWRYWWNDTCREIYAAAMRRYLAAGWIDVPHTFFATKRSDAARFNRGHVRDVLAEWRRIGFAPAVWVDHARNPWNISTYRTAFLARSAEAGGTLIALTGSLERAGSAPTWIRTLASGDRVGFTHSGEVCSVASAAAAGDDGRATIRLEEPLRSAHPCGTAVSIHPARKPVEGAVAGSPYYCADLASEAGVRAYWTRLPADVAAATAHGRWGFPTTLTPQALPDGRAVWGLMRCYEPGQTNNTWLGACLRRALTGDELSEGRPVDPDTYMIVSTHLGYADADGIPDAAYTIEDDVFGFNGGRWFNTETVAAFRELRAAQDAGRVLVARTSRLVRYNLVHDALGRDAETEHGFTIQRRNGTELFVIHAIDDRVSDRRPPELDDVRGITFYCDDPATSEIRLGQAPVADIHIQRNGPDHTGRASIGVRWHVPDVTDYTVGVG